MNQLDEENTNTPEYKTGKPLRNSEVIVPNDFILKEEFDILLYMAEKYFDEVDITIYTPLSNSEIVAFENRTKIRLTDELKEFYQFSNGFWNKIMMSVDCLEEVEQLFEIGTCDWAEEGDSGDYLVLGSDGGGYYLLMKIKTGELVKCDDEGEIRSIGTLKDLLCWEIDFMYQDLCGENDEKIKDYLERNKERL